MYIIYIVESLQTITKHLSRTRAIHIIIIIIFCHAINVGYVGADHGHFRVRVETHKLART